MKFFSNFYKNFIKKNQKIIDSINAFFKKYLIGYIVFSLIFSFLLLFLVDRSHKNTLYSVPVINSFSYNDIKAKDFIEIVDDDKTKKLKQLALSDLYTVYDFQADYLKEVIDKWESTVDDARSLKIKNGDKSQLGILFQDNLNINLSDQEINFLKSSKYSRSFHQVTNDALSGFIGEPILANDFVGKNIQLVEVSSGEKINATEEVVGKYYTVQRVINEISRELNSSKNYFWKSLNEKGKSFLISVLAKLIRENISLNFKENEKVKLQSLNSVKPSLIRFAKGQKIIEKGQRINAQDIQLIRKINDKITQERSRYLFYLKWLFLFLFTVIFIIYFKRNNLLKWENKNNLLIPLTILVSLFVFRGVFSLNFNILAEAMPNLPLELFLFGIPLAFPSMLMRFLVNARSSWLVALVFSAAIIVFLKTGFLFGVYALITSIFGALLVNKVRTRMDVYMSGLWTGLLASLCAVVIVILWNFKFPDSPGFIRTINSTELSQYQILLWAGIGGFLSGLVSSFLTAIVTPVLEVLFGFTSDLKLLELARMDHPLLRQLVLTAPGTYHHSIVVGSLAEEAASAIGADSLLARVGAYYHDIGKTERPEYFTENQDETQKNIYQDKKPSLAAKIIIQHVKKGVEMAKEHNLGRQIIDCIEQHHGTSLVRYFYHKACEESPEGKVPEEGFRYPGPKPQNKVTAIMSLADSAEAATRSLKNPTPSRIEGMVSKIVSSAMEDGQLDEANITFAEASKIKLAFVRILLGIHHNRIEYPDENGKKDN